MWEGETAVASRKLSFTTMEWTQGGHPLERKKAVAEVPVAVLEFAPGFRDPNWCERGHSGYVISGTLELELAEDRLVIEEGEGFEIDRGTPHRASNPGDRSVRFFIVSC